jgi:hypothetical protein
MICWEWCLERYAVKVLRSRVVGENVVKRDLAVVVVSISVVMWVKTPRVNCMHRVLEEKQC